MTEDTLPPLPKPDVPNTRLPLPDAFTEGSFSRSATLAIQQAAFAVGVAAGQRSGEGWQPIETAPKDGTRIVLCNAENAYAGAWRTRPYGGYAWMASEHVAAFSPYSPKQPTHWMLLPSAPQPTGERP